MKTAHIRKLFIDYFKSKGHTEVKSAPLIPQNDPTLLFTNAGMVQFKNVFLGTEKKPYTKAVSVQKCVRAGGKHNDLENVGHTARHHTFFEMLGNFSFGDYFKKEAISYAWDFVTKHLKIDQEKLTVTIFKDDEESFKIWHEVIGLPKNRIVRFGEKDNFWQMAETGPCGPCSEIFYDMGEKVGCGKSTCQTGCECDRFVEIWNLVFMQFNRDEKGGLTPLPKPCVDTGMGLERTAALLQGKTNNYDIDLFQDLIKHIEKITRKKYKGNTHDRVSFRVIADHIRAITFLIGDGILPSNEGRGYVLRRIMRRAIRYGRHIGLKKPFLYKISEKLINIMKDAYPDLKDKKNFIEKMIFTEEEKFLETLEKGLSLFNSHVHALKKEKKSQMPADIVFKLYDTYGFPLDLTRILAQEEKMTLDEEEFNTLMKVQRERAKASWKASPKFKEIYKKLGEKNIKNQFLGYKTLEINATLLYIVKGNDLVQEAKEGEEVELVFDKTPFYAESGGQVGDQGKIAKKVDKKNETIIEIDNTFSPHDGIIAHKGKIIKGSIKLKQKYNLNVNPDTRHRTALNHTATHLLHYVLKHILGDHVKQAGSLVEPDRLRFDYTHFKPTTVLELQKIEDLINEKILENNETKTEVMGYEEAVKKGAIAIFEEKYGNRVRCVQLGDYSKELCGGTHAHNTGLLKLFKIVSDFAIGSGVRRIEAVTEKKAFEFLGSAYETVKDLSNILKTTPREVPLKVEKLLHNYKELQKQIDKFKSQTHSNDSENLLSKIKMLNGVSVLITHVPEADPKTLRHYSDVIRQKLKSGIFALGSSVDGKVFLLVGVTEDLAQKYHAGSLIKHIAPLVGGSGGGGAHMAQAGGTKPEKLDEALKKLEDLI
ncbi:MAG: alanine--tRNA ligase [Deltaproteobacteria bacterium]|nr:alanine--tRNA ligase [Deltaproteobacteria bacterium]